MNKKLITRASSILLYLHGLIEVAALLLLHPIGKQFFSEIAGHNGSGDAYFLAITGFIWGVTRLIAGTGIWLMKKWAVVLGLIVSTVTLIVATTLIPFGIVDLLLAVPVLIILLYIYFENQQI